MLQLHAKASRNPGSLFAWHLPCSCRTATGLQVRVATLIIVANAVQTACQGANGLHLPSPLLQVHMCCPQCNISVDYSLSCCFHLTGVSTIPAPPSHPTGLPACTPPGMSPTTELKRSPFSPPFCPTPVPCRWALASMGCSACSSLAYNALSSTDH